MTFETVIGLEVHLQLSTATKLFCGCPAKFGAPPNSQTCPVCLGLPGVLPVLNERALEWGVRVALAVDCQVARVMKFDRKQYFYPDLPKNYQISQYDQPLAQHGHLEIAAGAAGPPTKDVGGGAGDGASAEPRRIGIRRVHLEEDAGKLLHEASRTETCIDFNRTGVPLLEIVSEPDLRSSEEAYQYLTELKAVIEYLGVSTCNMEEGSLRCDTNISLRRPGESALGAKVEIKNLNSFRAVRLALEYEATRQAAVLSRGERLVQETRLWDAKALKTEPMRSKEEAADYRYFPEPDLVPFTIDPQLITRSRGALPELPRERRARYEAAYGLSAYDARVLTQHRAFGELFEGALRAGASPKPVANWMMGDFLAYLNANNLEPEAVKLRPEWLAHLVQLIADGTLSGKMAKEVFAEALARGVDPRELVKAGGLRQIVDAGRLAHIAEAVLQANPKSVEDYRKGKANALTYLMGQAMKHSQGKANPQQIAALLKRKLEQAVEKE